MAAVVVASTCCPPASALQAAKGRLVVAKLRWLPVLLMSCVAKCVDTALAPSFLACPAPGAIDRFWWIYLDFAVPKP
eukprot:COSAG02_NODE_2025_length_10084_cov_8.514372_5_plen_77_part_00